MSRTQLQGMPDKLIIGTRNSALALWQAEYIKGRLAAAGVDAELLLISSDGEKDLVSPLYEMGVQGIFTKTLDTALLQKKIDIAVHSLKDVPTQLPAGLVLAAVPERGNFRDVLVYKHNLPEPGIPYTVATSSLRRSAQWKHRFEGHNTAVLRGNINTRISKLEQEAQWDAALFAAAGIERIQLAVPNSIELDWMIPAPAQGALAVVCRSDNKEIYDLCRKLNHEDSETACRAERSFLRSLMGGCSMPIGAHASIRDGRIFLNGCVLSIDGSRIARVDIDLALSEAENLGETAALELLEAGGRDIIAGFSKTP